MLVLTRRAGQTIHIGEDIEITVTEIQGDQVRIGVTAPPEVRVLREELTEEGQDARIEALIARTWGEAGQGDPAFGQAG